MAFQQITEPGCFKRGTAGSRAGGASDGPHDEACSLPPGFLPAPEPAGHCRQHVPKATASEERAGVGHQSHQPAGEAALCNWLRCFRQGAAETAAAAEQTKAWH